MKMSRLEKVFVNRENHSDRVAARAAELVARIAPAAGSRYLDVGCGNGAAACLIARSASLQVTGVDIDPEQIDAAIRRASSDDKLRFLVADATDLPFSDGAFDIVAANKVTHHVIEWEHALSEMLRVVAPNGHLVFADLVVPRWLAACGRILTGGSVSFPVRSTIEALVADRGFSLFWQSSSAIAWSAIWRSG